MATSPDTPTTSIEMTDVRPARNPLPEVPARVAAGALLAPPPPEWDGRSGMPANRPVKAVEACGSRHGRLVAGVHYHPVVASVHLAFRGHRPLVLSPDMVWLLVAQGFANHVNANAEELRPKLVAHAGKVTIAVRRDDFVKGSPDNPWPEVFGEFSRCVREHIGATTHDLLLPDFTTTGAVERAAAEIVLLDAVQSYFSYEFYTLCGIPQIILEGTTQDWEKLADRTRAIERFGLSWWTDALAPILDEFVAAVRGHVNEAFWRSIYKLDEASGGPFISGWITAFFPYLKDEETGRKTVRNHWLANGGSGLEKLLFPPAESDPLCLWLGPTTEDFPGGLSRVPFVWDHAGRRDTMEFLGGFVGVGQDAETLRLRPEIGWAVREWGEG